MRFLPGTAPMADGPYGPMGAGSPPVGGGPRGGRGGGRRGGGFRGGGGKPPPLLHPSTYLTCVRQTQRRVFIYLFVCVYF